ncbi:MAG: hypothetical protein V2A73_00055 [Pseudomonadota bacterium]
MSESYIDLVIRREKKHFLADLVVAILATSMLAIAITAILG